jgi:NAD(P)-dependent dehydrogenase (short-subunit alcohol dehydrogenase family)
MAGYRLDGRTAIVTGAGGKPSLGRAHALLLARLGANVVVNDIGPAVETPGYPDAASADAVVEEIRAFGGKAAADSNSVATDEGARAIIQTALDAFGGVDILVNNAAFSITASFEDLTPRDFERHIQVNLMGPVLTCRAAWPHMRARGYGRIINTASRAMVGGAGLSAYGASKGGLFSFTRSLASEGAAFGIKVNAVNPGAFTRLVMATQNEGSYFYDRMKPLSAELVSPVIAYLAHEDCPVTGECIEAVGGSVSRFYLAETAGFADRELTIEKLAERWEEVMAGADPSVIGHGANQLNELLTGAKPYDPATRS